MSAEGDLWTDPDVCLDEGCIIDGQGDPAPEEGGAIPDKPDEDGHLDQW
jgi:hypothetical protein